MPQMNLWEQLAGKKAFDAQKNSGYSRHRAAKVQALVAAAQSGLKELLRLMPQMKLQERLLQQLNGKTLPFARMELSLSGILAELPFLLDCFFLI